MKTWNLWLVAMLAAGACSAPVALADELRFIDLNHPSVVSHWEMHGQPVALPELEPFNWGPLWEENLWYDVAEGVYVYEWDNTMLQDFNVHLVAVGHEGETSAASNVVVLPEPGALGLAAGLVALLFFRGREEECSQ